MHVAPGNLLDWTLFLFVYSLKNDRTKWYSFASPNIVDPKVVIVTLAAIAVVAQLQTLLVRRLPVDAS